MGGPRIQKIIILITRQISKSIASNITARLKSKQSNRKKKLTEVSTGIFNIWTQVWSKGSKCFMESDAGSVKKRLAHFSLAAMVVSCSPSELYCYVWPTSSMARYVHPRNTNTVGVKVSEMTCMHCKETWRQFLIDITWVL